MLGGPGTGKKTHAEECEWDYYFKFLSMDNLLKEEVFNSHNLGQVRLIKWGNH